MALSDQVNTGLRYVGVAGSSAFAVLAALGAISPDQSQQLVADLHQMVDGLQQAFGAASKIIVIIGPIVGTWLAAVGIRSSSLPARIQTLLQMANADPEAKKQLVQATAQLPEVKQVVAAPALANTVPSQKVVSP